jgi:hypothetical protein
MTAMAHDDDDGFLERLRALSQARPPSSKPPAAQAAPKKPAARKRQSETVRQVIPRIQEDIRLFLRAAGTYADIARILTANGVPATLRQVEVLYGESAAMPTPTGRRSTRVVNIRKALARHRHNDAFPPGLIPDVVRIRDSGVPFEEIADIITRRGCKVTATTLRGVYSRHKAMASTSFNVDMNGRAT